EFHSRCLQNLKCECVVRMTNISRSRAAFSTLEELRQSCSLILAVVCGQMSAISHLRGSTSRVVAKEKRPGSSVCAVGKMPRDFSSETRPFSPFRLCDFEKAKNARQRRFVG